MNVEQLQRELDAAQKAEAEAKQTQQQLSLRIAILEAERTHRDVPVAGTTDAKVMDAYRQLYNALYPKQN